MKKITTVAVIAALALATQVFAMGGSTKSGQAMPTTTMKSGATMTTGTTMKTGATTMTPSSTMSGTGTMTATMSGSGMTKPQTMPVTPMQPATTK